MESKRMDLNKRYFFILSGLSNSLGKTLAVEMCRRFKSGSIAVLIDVCENILQEVKKEIQFLENGIQVISCAIESWQKADRALFRQLFDAILHKFSDNTYESAFILHNEGTGATQDLMEPQEQKQWMQYLHENLYAPVALNQEFLNTKQFADMKKIAVNITSNFLLQPFVYSSLNCSCLKARDMYFRVMADGEEKNNVLAISYYPGLLETHKPQYDHNNNVINLTDLEIDDKLLKLPRVKPIQTTLKLINILQEMSHISAHDVDYYDTFVL